MTKRAAGTAVVELQALVNQHVKRSKDVRAIVLSGDDVAELLTELISIVEQALTRWASIYSPVQWLWTLRRVDPSVFKGDLSTTFGYDLALAETISGHSTARGGARIASNQLAYVLAESDAARVWRFCAGVRYLSNLHQTYRWANKGAPVRFAKRGPPQAEPSDELRQAAYAYDQRMDASSSYLAHSGNIAIPDSGGDAAITAFIQSEPFIMRVPDLPGPPALKAETVTRYVPHTVDFGPYIKVILHEPTPRDPSIAKEVAALGCLLSALYEFLWNHRQISGALQRGYLRWRREKLEQVFEDAYTRLPARFKKLVAWSGIVSAVEWIDIIKGMRGMSWPLVAGPVLRIDDDEVLLDLYSASVRLNTLISDFARDGEAANTRSNLFELRVQGLLDESPWQAPTTVRNMRGLTLRLGGKHLTDIDAIGCKDNQLLLVSCKSTIYSPQYDAGDFRVIRNRESLLLGAIRDWEKKVTFLQRNPVGDNYDFSNFDLIEGVVCTPLPVFVMHMPDVCTTPKGLLSGCSFVELESWLGNGTS
ncbi:hypothetical protein DWU98_17505 [Dyella monticola]|uniref:Uncharacterized protein n=1 Tax=Dyella monticola TaxID=1927958 RepID=A0A370WU96_9GAMM|nr:hypothetical protein [Dyella monticola]RDS79586.1 hypothetical protein DWU98_17505 [Dyella monticola]